MTSEAYLEIENRAGDGFKPDLAAFPILGVQVHPLTMEDLHNRIGRIIETHGHRLVLNVNANCLNLAYRNPWLRDQLNTADVVFCDGEGVKIGARILGHHVPTRITYADWMWELARLAGDQGWTFFFLGARPGVAERAAAQLSAQCPRLKIIGTHHGYFDKAADSAENQAVLERINRAKPNILVVGFGMPLQERWLLENWEGLEANVALTGGAVFDFVSGRIRRAPRWMTDNGLEWLGRLAIEPGRLWKRYLIGNPLFLYRVVRQRLGLLEFDE